MYRDHSVGVVVPAFNEEGFVGGVIQTVPDLVDTIYVVDDCSTDGTWDEIVSTAGGPDDDPASATTDGGEAGVTTPTPGPSGDRGIGGDGPATGATAGGSGASRSSAGPEPGGGSQPDETDGSPRATRVVTIRHEENRGVGGAIKTGYLAARADGLDVVAVMGGDGQMDPDDLDRLLDPIVADRADYAKGNRLLESDHHADMPRHRLVGNGILTLLTKVATGYWSIGDPQMGYTAISGEALQSAAVEEMYEYYGYCNDLLVRLSTAGYRVADVPCPLDYADETSHIAYREYVPRVSGMLLRSFLRRLWADRRSATGATRLALFVGGWVATALGLVFGAAGAPGGGPDGTDPTRDAPGRPTPSATDATRGTGPDSSDRFRWTIALGVAALVAGMLVDGVVNSPLNYTERISEEDQ